MFLSGAVPVGLVFVAIICTVAAIAGILLWEGAGYFSNTDDYSDLKWYGYDTTSFIGLVLFSTFVAPAVTLWYVVGSTMLRIYGNVALHEKRYTALALYVFLACIFFAGGLTPALAWATDPLRCAVAFCIGVQKYQRTFSIPLYGASLNAVTAFLLAFTLCPLAVVMWIRALLLWRGWARESWLHDPYAPIDPNDHLLLNASAITSGGNRDKRVEGAFSPGPAMRVYRRGSLLKELLLVTVVVAALLCCALFTFYLPNDTRFFIPSLISKFAAQKVSLDVMDSNHTVPELPNAVFRTYDIHVSDDLHLKLFPENVFLYIYLIGVLLVVWMLHLTQYGRYWIKRRIPLIPHVSIGEVVFISVTILLVVAFFFYWIHDHNFKNYWAPNVEATVFMKPAEHWGRAMGQLAVLFLALLLFPASRNSVMFQLMGISREGVLWAHRILGYCMLGATAGHAIARYVLCYQNGVLLQNIVYIPIVVNQVWADFTVLHATWATAILFLAMGVLSLSVVRRNLYEVFYYSHIVSAYLVLPVVLWHAPMGWEFMLPGLVLWLIDRLIRLFQSSARATVKHARQLDANHIEIGFTTERCNMQRTYPGQYVFVNVPEICALQWHPFTLCNPALSPEGRGGQLTVFTLLIKSMGSGTWTQKLLDYVAHGRSFTLGVDGPYGTPIDFSCYDKVLLVGGAIGVTPCASIYGSLLRQKQNDESTPRHVKLIWPLRDTSLIGALAPSLGLPEAWVKLANMDAATEQPTHQLAAVHAFDEDNPAEEFEDRSRYKSDTLGQPDLPFRDSDSSRSDDSFADEMDERRLEETSNEGNDHQCMPEIPQACRYECNIFITTSEGFGTMRRLENLDGRGCFNTNLRRPTSCVSFESCSSDSSNVSWPLQHLVGTEVVGDVEATYRVYDCRPDLEEEVNIMVTQKHGKASVASRARTLIFVCGPKPLVRDVQRLGAELGYEVHEETFHF